MLLAIYMHGNIVEGFNSGLAVFKCQAFEKQHSYPLKSYSFAWNVGLLQAYIMTLVWVILRFKNCLGGMAGGGRQLLWMVLNTNTRVS